MLLLTSALTLLTLSEFVVRRQLNQLGQSLSGLYSGNPKRATFRPITEQLLAVYLPSSKTIDNALIHFYLKNAQKGFDSQ